MKLEISWKDKLLFGLYHLVDTHNQWIMALASGFILGRATNEMSVPRITIPGVLQGLFSVSDRATNYFSWLAIILLITIPIGHRVLRRLHTRRRYDRLFAALVEKHRSRAISPYSGIAWDEALSLQTCPELNRGWLMSETKLVHNTTRFTLPDKFQQTYKEYFNKYYEEKRFFDNGVKYMVTRNPIAFSDSTTLVLHTQETLYSEVKFYGDYVATIVPERDSLIRETISGHVRFPHSLCMHMIVVTQDDKILLTKRSEKVAFSPGTWSCSVEEQLSPDDFLASEHSPIMNWARRFLKEELGFGSEEYDVTNLRVLSVFLESEILNVSLCTHVVLNTHSSELDKILQALPRKDYEFTDWTFVSHEELMGELFQPRRAYHPTSGYRILMGLLRRYGEPKVAEMFLHHA